ncbi:MULTISPECIES: type III secretion system export apparatus subunit SctU [Chlamydia]|uniref:Yop proteins translocation protein U,type III secretion system protein,type III secretion protein, YscU/HrpY family,FlhB HrpN YscU SpaS Family n=2 Tax=Chlamydia TaxID=810 RepID=A0A3B0PP47_9CHLA|nr:MULTISPECIES: type III secretion system export apparatus subunit SctU [Chlamydia]QVE49002.1 type III secretion system export apparatus subunit SctU [Chlamydia crocodili]SYX08943.1 Yop proteins translocation protein U,type III secretion system protein,type III secretion protein, YscU/HrpY family,FlhB HrpN YscU SpaS Family [Chlamydia poikilotherma]
MGEKTEKATPKRLRDARKKGQVAKSQDFPSAVTFIVSMFTTFYLSSFFAKHLGSFLVSIFKEAPTNHDPRVTLYYLHSCLTLILTTSLPLLGAVGFVGILVGFLVVGPTFSTEVFKPDLKKFNPIENLKQKFKVKTLIELLKSILKIFGAALILYVTLKNRVPLIIETAGVSPIVIAVIFKQILYKAVTSIGIFFLVVAVLDLVYQRKNFAKELKMEKFEVKQEFKDTEGNPEIKGRRRQIAQEIAYEDTSSQIKHASAVVSNPKDIAVAIGYMPEKYKAPWIIAMGINLRAKRIITEAEKYGIPIMRNVPLAHQLWDEGKELKFIPESTYEAIGEILLYITSLNAQNPNNKNINQPDNL